jgi:uncharacterized Tic20 family protein
MTSKRPNPIRFVAVLTLLGSILPILTLGRGAALSLPLYGIATLMLFGFTKRRDVRLALFASVACFLGSLFTFAGLLGPVMLFGIVISWLEAVRRQASETPGSRAAIHFRSVQYFLLIISITTLFFRTSTDLATAWLSSIAAGLGLSVCIYMILASYSWWAELKPGRKSESEQSDSLSL